MFAKIISRRDGIPRSADGPRRDVRSIVRLERLDGVEIRGGRFRHGSVESPSVRAAVATDILLLRACRPRRDGRLPFRRPVAEIRRRLRVRPRTSRGDGRDVIASRVAKDILVVLGVDHAVDPPPPAQPRAPPPPPPPPRAPRDVSPSYRRRPCFPRRADAAKAGPTVPEPGRPSPGTVEPAARRDRDRRGSHRRRGYVGRGCAREVERERDAPGGESLVRSNFRGDVVGAEARPAWRPRATEGSLRRRRVERVRDSARDAGLPPHVRARARFAASLEGDVFLRLGHLRSDFAEEGEVEAFDEVGVFDVAAEELRFLDGELPELVAGSHAGHASGNAGQDRTAQFALILGRGLLAAFLGAIAVRVPLGGPPLAWAWARASSAWASEIATAAASPPLGATWAPPAARGVERSFLKSLFVIGVAAGRYRRRPWAWTAGGGLANSGASGGAVVHTHGRCPGLSSRRALGGEGLSLSRARVSCFETSMRGRKCPLVCAERCEADLVEAPGEQCRSLTTMCGFDHTRVWRVCFSMNLWKFDQSRTAKSARERLRLRERSQASKKSSQLRR